MQLADQSTMGRRLRDDETTSFLTKFAHRVAGSQQPALIKAIDGKPLVIPKHSTGPDAGYGRSIGGMAKGDKLHAICDGSAITPAWSVEPINVSELNQADKLVPQLKAEGYILLHYHRRPSLRQARPNRPPRSCCWDWAPLSAAGRSEPDR